MIYKAYIRESYEPDKNKCLINAENKHEAFKEYLKFIYEDCNYSRDIDITKHKEHRCDICIENINDEMLKIEMLQKQESVNRLELNI